MPISNQQAVFRGRFRPIRATLLGLTAAQAIFAGSAHGGPTTLWNLDRIDQRDQPGDGRFCPVGHGSTVNVYVVSTGVLDSHDEFAPAGRASCFYDFQGLGCPDLDGRGTWLASIVGGTTHGVARGAQIHSVRVAAALPWTPAALRNGLSYIRNNGSLPGVVLIDGVTGADPLIDAEVTALVNAGYVVVAGAGDDNADACNYSPARVSDAITVSATDLADDRTPNGLGGLVGGNYGTCVDMFAPGVDVTGAWRTGPSDTNMVSGVSTAASAAHVAGAAALVLDVNPGLSPAAVRSSITNDATVGVISDPGSGSPNRLLYVQPGTCDPCPTCGGGVSTTNQAMTASIVGPVNGTPWSWKIVANNPGDFPDTPIVFVPGVTVDYNGDGNVDEMDVVQKLADSINTYWATVGCDSSSVTGNIWASTMWVPGVNGPVPYISISSKCPFTLYVSDANVDPLDPTCAVVFPFTCQINPTVQPFPGSGTDCNRNGSDDFFDTTFGLSPDVNLNAIPDECEGLAAEAVNFGLLMQATGQAIVANTTADGVPAIVVFNIGPGGDDGISIDTGPIPYGGLGFTLANAAGTAQPGGVVTHRYFGSIDGAGAGDQLLATVSSTRGDDNVVLSHDLSLLAVTTATFEVYDGTTLVGSFEDLPVATPITMSPIDPADAVPGDEVSTSFMSDPGQERGKVVWVNPPMKAARIQVGGEDPIDGTQVEVAFNIEPEVLLRSVEIVASDVPSLRITSMSLGAFCLLQRATGAAMMTGIAGGLDVSSTDASSSYGVSIEPASFGLSGGQQLNIDTLPFQLMPQQQLRYSAIGRWSGTAAHVPIGSINTDVVNGSVWCHCVQMIPGDLVDSYSMRVYRDGEFIGTLHPTIDNCAWICEDVVGWYPAPVVLPGGPLPDRVEMGLRTSAPVTFEVDITGGAAGPTEGTASALVGDEIRFVLEGVEGLEAITNVELIADGPESFTITGETVETLCPADLDGSGDVGFADLTALLGAWGPCGAGPCPADLDGDGDVGFTDLTALLGVWGPCA